jgi:glycosyltransferase involved in cell wall biosynthesis
MDNKIKLSVVLATLNEETFIGDCLKSVRDIADEIIIFDETSTDKTKEIAEGLGAIVYTVEHEQHFHITKQKAIDKAQGEWVLQLDADERVTPALAEDIKRIITLSNKEIKERKLNSKKMKLFLRHQALLTQRDGEIGMPTGEVVAFFIPRLNYFLGKPLIHAGVYPDGVIRLFKRGRAHLPPESVHAQMVIEGEVAWLQNDLEHHDSPTFAKYLKRMNRYTTLHAEELKKEGVKKSCGGFINYVFMKPLTTFCKLYFRHLGILDGIQGFIWSLFSSLHFPVAYFKYWTKKG